MTFFGTYNTDGTVGRIKCSLSGGLVPLSDIFDGGRRIPYGTSVQITELAVIRTIPTNLSLIDVDLRHYSPRFYIGSWETRNVLFGTGSSVPVEYGKPDGLQGYINSFNQQIFNKEMWTMCGKVTPGQFTIWSGEIDQCNFALEPVVPGLTTFPNSIFQAVNTAGLLKMRSLNEDQSVSSGFFKSQLEEIFIYLNPGAQLASVDYYAYAENFLYSDVPTAATTQCVLGSDCDAEFDAFIRSINAGEPINTIPLAGGFGVFSSQSACDAVPPGIGCTEYIFTCTDGQNRSYWQPSGN
jgi:hypothetical protein